MALRLPQIFRNPKSFGSENNGRNRFDFLSAVKLNRKEQESYRLAKNNVPLGLRCNSSRLFSLGALSSMASAYSDQSSSGDEVLVAKVDDREMEFNRINCLVSVLHESARSFTVAVESLDLVGSGLELAMAWVGKDVHEWHKRIAYQVAVYALLKTAIEVEVFLSQERCNDPSPVREILTPKLNMVGEYIEKQLSTRHPDLVEWFRVVEQPRIAGFFIPMLKNWSMEYAGSGVAGIIVAISCCTAVEKLGPGRISCPLFTFSVDDVLIELMSYSHSLVQVDKLHHLATEAGFEQDFLSHFGTKVLTNNIEDLEFWIGLAQKKLSVAFERESMSAGMRISHEKVQADSLATLGIFAYLGRRTALFLSQAGIKDIDEQVKDFLGYLECGSLFIYPEFSSISTYQLFIEIVTDEIGWLDFYAGFPTARNQDKKRPKQHVIQAEKEIILSRVFTVCYDVFSGFAHFCRSTQLPMDRTLLAFLLRSQNLLSICLEDYWAAYDGSGGREILGLALIFCGSDLRRIAEASALKSRPSMRSEGNAKITLDSQQKPSDFTAQEHPESTCQHEAQLRKDASSCWLLDATSEGASTEKACLLRENFLRKYSTKLMAASYDIWTGTELLLVDVMIAMELLLKQLRGHKATKREKKKLKQTLNDLATLVPITILMLLPVSAVGHAAMFAAIKRYTPFLIPSPYSSERLDIIKQLKRTKKKEVRSWSSLEDPSSKSHKQ